MTREKRAPAPMLISILVAALMFGALATEAQAALRHVDGTVLSKNAGDRTFRIKTEAGKRITVRVDGNTRFERIKGGFGGLHAGLMVEVDAKQTNGGLLAKQVQARQAGSGGGGGGGGADDGPHHH